jgi:hypothetical protein
LLKASTALNTSSSQTKTISESPLGARAAQCAIWLGQFPFTVERELTSRAMPFLRREFFRRYFGNFSELFKDFGERVSLLSAAT